MEVNFMSWYEAYASSQSLAYYWYAYQIIFALAAVAVAKINNQD